MGLQSAPDCYTNSCFPVGGDAPGFAVADAFEADGEGKGKGKKAKGKGGKGAPPPEPDEAIFANAPNDPAWGAQQQPAPAVP
eukprot:4551006-Prymnesium_polylepis.1